MTQYWIVDTEPLQNEDGEALLIVHNALELGDVWSWKSGARLAEDETNFPMPVKIPFDRRRGYSGPPLDLMDLGVPIMSPRLYSCILGAGVTNLDTYAAVLTDSSSGEELPYLIYNVVGRVAAVDLSNSEMVSFDKGYRSDASIERLVLDEHVIRGLLMFRLNENVNALVIHNSVKVAIELQDIKPLTFYKPEDWAQF